MTQQALTIKQDQTPIVTELTARDVFNIWLPDQVDGIKVVVLHGTGGNEGETVLRDDVHHALRAYLKTKSDLKSLRPLFLRPHTLPDYRLKFGTVT